PSFQGLRADKPARTVVRESPQAPAADRDPPPAERAVVRESAQTPAVDRNRSPAKAAGGRTKTARGTTRRTPARPAPSAATARTVPPATTPRSAGARRGDAEVAGVRISHPERVLYAEDGITKLEVARFYEAIGEWIVPHVAGRPLTLVRCPKGIGE